MRLDGRRESSNVEDRRGMSGGAKAGIGGIGGVILIALVTFLGGGDIGDVFNAVQQNAAQQTATQGEYTPSAEEEELASFSKKILAGTEDVWTEIFKQSGRTYQPPKLVLFTNAVSSGCGNATASVGPFYCSADQTV